MIPKGKLLALLMIFTAVGGVAATGAFTTVEAERTADVSVAGDANALLAISPNNADTNDFVDQANTDDAELQIDLSGGTASDLNTDAATNEEDIITITNNGEDAASFFIVTEGGLQDNSIQADSGDVSDDVNVEFYIDDGNVVSSSSDAGSDDVVLVSSGTDPTPLASDITSSLDTFVDGSNDSSDASADYTITQEGSRSPSRPARAVELGPGESVDVSIYVEINVDDSDFAENNLNSNVSVLDNIVVVAQDSSELNGALEST